MEQNTPTSQAVTSIAVKTFFAFEPLVAKELTDLGYHVTSQDTRLVTLEGTLNDVYKLNYNLRTALRVLVPIKKFIIHSSDDLYRKVKKTDWSEWLDTETTFAIDPHVTSNLFRHPHFASLRMKDAIADHFTDRFGKRPDVDAESPDISFDLHIDAGNRVTISLDSSGTSLNQRGYRVSGGQAPLN
ncbi:MAG: class I SAM-dependent RNA methyltransferase, partial [Flavobacteriales bacterium]|nr:class I SAM-dependent RNA methyltransferase [Flavobacteriales bacterium]